jgi:hypothetical protein
MVPDDETPDPVALLTTLRLLADDASFLRLDRTVAALQQAMETCRTEAVRRGRPASSALH